MKLIFLTVLALGLADTAQAADNFDTSAGAAYRPTLAKPAVDQVNHEAYEHAKAAYDRILDEGGCNADVLPVEIAAYCFNGAVNAANKSGPVGAGSGGSDGSSD